MFVYTFAMAQLSAATLFVLFGLVASEEVFRPSTNTSGISFGSFFHHRGHKLLAANLKNERVKSPAKCLARCISTNGCLSVNVNTTNDERGLYGCELLASHKYQDQSSFVPSKGIDHYSIASQCEKYPCQHGAKCVPLYPNYAYKCEILPGCDEEWLKFGNYCYFFNYDSSGQADWHGAFRACQLLGGHLIDIRNEGEWQFVKSNLPTSLYDQYIIGMTDAGREGQWKYVDGSAVSFFKWKDGEPNGGTKENCGTVFTNNHIGYYNDAPCTHENGRFICKKGTA